MNWRKWKLGALVAAITGILKGVIGMALDMTAKQIGILLAVSFASDLLLFLKTNPVEKVTFETEQITTTAVITKTTEKTP